MDFDILACELIRTLRGPRSQPAFSRRLGYKSNVVYTWEAGRGAPTAAGFLVAASRVGIDLREVLVGFYRSAPDWLEHVEPATGSGVAAFLNDLRGRTSIVDLAAYTGKSRFAIARWMKGETEPKLPDFLRLVEATSLRLVDFLELIVDPAQLPSIRERWRAISAARRLAYEVPWTQAMLRALELEDYQQQPHREGWLAMKVGVSLDVERVALKRLSDAGQIRWDGSRWEVAEVLAVDTRKNPKLALEAKCWWGEVGLERVAAGHRGMVYNLFGVSTEDLHRLRDLQRAYYNEVRTLVAQSTPVQHVGLSAMLLVDLGEGSTSGVM